MMTKTLESELARLESLSTIERGWLDGEGEKVSPAALSRVAGMLKSSGAPIGELYFYPTPEGGISVELDRTQWSLSIDVHPDATKAVLFAFHNYRHEDSEEHTLPLNTDAEVSALWTKVNTYI